LVQPSKGLSSESVETELSVVLSTVVPTAQIFFLPALAALTLLQAASSIKISSEYILCLVKSSTSTELKLPKLACKVTCAKLIPFISNRFRSCLLKCKPAVGAATAPSCLA